MAKQPRSTRTRRSSRPRPSGEARPANPNCRDGYLYDGERPLRDRAGALLTCHVCGGRGCLPDNTQI